MIDDDDVGPIPRPSPRFPTFSTLRRFGTTKLAKVEVLPSGEIKVDGNLLKGVRKIDITTAVGLPTVVTIEMYAELT